ncbi:hypothetical protein [Nocardia wallacei]|uniref:hypothetical protein n=1 Tax=Nocardia wallacei TaxID=480035 RepID=UPI002454000F|nr:hypothetical protein [Nocardia wallacei]
MIQQPPQYVGGAGVLVAVLGVAPGEAILSPLRDTDFFRRAKLLASRIGQGPKESPADVARQGIDALLDDEQKAVAGSLGTEAAGLVTRVLPDTVKVEAHQLVSSPTRGR